jgi:hypothetical protein
MPKREALNGRQVDIMQHLFEVSRMPKVRRDYPLTARALCRLAGYLYRTLDDIDLALSNPTHQIACAAPGRDEGNLFDLEELCQEVIGTKYPINRRIKED